MVLLDTFPELCARFPHGASFSLPAWREYAEKISPELPAMAESVCAKYDMARDVLPVIWAALDQRERLEEAHASFLHAIQQIEKKTEDLYGAPLDCTLVFYLGLCCAAGWAVKLNGKPAVLLGVEKVVELGWGNQDDMQSLVYHELGHHLHSALGCMAEELPQSTGEKAVFQLYQEGMAMVFEQELSGDAGRFHQDKNGWLAWCRSHEAAMKEEFRRRVSQNESCQDFFGDWCRFLGQPDTGYYLGCRFVRQMLEHLPLREAASLPLPSLLTEWEQFSRQ